MAERSPRNMTDYEAEYAAFQWDRPERFNFAIDVVDRCGAASAPTRPALLRTATTAEPEGASPSRELAERSLHAAHSSATWGCGRGDRRLHHAAARRRSGGSSRWAACARASSLMPGTPMLTAEGRPLSAGARTGTAVVTDAERLEVRGRCAHAESTTWISLGRGARAVGPLRAGLVDGARTGSLRAHARRRPALVYFTSGTTGMPKMVLHTHASYGIGHVVTGKLLARSDAGRPALDALRHGLGQVRLGQALRPVEPGRVLVVYDFRGALRRARRCSTLLAARRSRPSARRPRRGEPSCCEDLEGWSSRRSATVVSAGEPLNPEVIEAWKRAPGLTIREGYGQTETVAHRAACSRALALAAGSMGKPSPGFDVARRSTTRRREVAVGQEGDIAVRVAARASGGPVRRLPGRRGDERGRLRGDWYVTGDRAVRDEDGYFWFVGRADDVIKTSGYRVGPFEVESALLEHPAVAESAVVGVPDESSASASRRSSSLAPGVAGSRRSPRSSRST